MRNRSLTQIASAPEGFYLQVDKMMGRVVAMGLDGNGQPCYVVATSGAHLRVIGETEIGLAEFAQALEDCGKDVSAYLFTPGQGKA